MTIQLLPTPADELPRLLFQSVAPPAHGDEIDRAIATARRRWPPLHPALTEAAPLVREYGVYQVPAEATELTLVKPAAGWPFRAISPSPTGLACTCDGWPPLVRAGPGDGLFCADILAYLLALYLERSFSALPYSAEELWQVTLEELRLQMTRATFDQWLLGSVVVLEASTTLFLTVALRNRYAQEWLTHRLHSVISRTLVAVAGYRVQVRFVVL
jgi:hypothetical protein